MALWPSAPLKGALLGPMGLAVLSVAASLHSQLVEQAEAAPAAEVAPHPAAQGGGGSGERGKQVNRCVGCVGVWGAAQASQRCCECTSVRWCCRAPAPALLAAHPTSLTGVP